MPGNGNLTCRNSLGNLIREATALDVGELGQSTYPPAIVLIHTVVTPELASVLTDLLTALELHGVYDAAANITLAVAGPGVHDAAMLVAGFRGRFGKVRVVKVHPSAAAWELASVNLLGQQCADLRSRGQRAHALYIHTKGLYSSGAGNAATKWQWRKVLEHFILKFHVEARSLLEHGYDTVGSNVINQDLGPPYRARMRVNPAHAYHYSGNFWWATSDHLARLPLLQLNHAIDSYERCKAENLVLSPMPNMCAGEIYHSEHAHMYSFFELPPMNVVVRTRPSMKLARSDLPCFVA